MYHYLRISTKNWQALGNQAEADKTMVWFYVGIPVMLSVFLDIPVAIAAYIVLLLSWYFLSNRKQQKYVLERFGKSYSRKNWGQPLAIALVASVAWQIVVNPNLRQNVLEKRSPSNLERQTSDATTIRQPGNTTKVDPVLPLPRCAEQQVLSTVHSLIIDGAGKGAVSYVNRWQNQLPEIGPEATKYVEQTVRNTPIRLASITNEAEDNVAKRRDCRAQIQIQGVNDSWESFIFYQIQATEGKEVTVLVQIPDIGKFVDLIHRNAATAYFAWRDDKGRTGSVEPREKTTSTVE